MDDISSTPVDAPAFSMMNDQEKTDWVLHAANEVVETLGFCDFGTINRLRENLQALDQNDSQMEDMKNEDLYECPLCVKTYYKSGCFKKHLEKKNCWKFCSVGCRFKSCSLLSFNVLLLRDACNAYQMGDGERIVTQCLIVMAVCFCSKTLKI